MHNFHMNIDLTLVSSAHLQCNFLLFNFAWNQTEILYSSTSNSELRWMWSFPQKKLKEEELAIRPAHFKPADRMQSVTRWRVTGRGDFGGLHYRLLQMIRMTEMQMTVCFPFWSGDLPTQTMKKFRVVKYKSQILIFQNNGVMLSLDQSTSAVRVWRISRWERLMTPQIHSSSHHNLLPILYLMWE